MQTTQTEIRYVVGKLQNGKACGGDAIPNEALKATIQATGAKLESLYTGCIRLGYFAEVWKKAKVVWIPNPKGGYRPISLLPAYGRVLDKILDNRLRDWIEKANVVSADQFGFREGGPVTIGSIKQLIRTVENKPANHHALIVLLDLSNAFNMAWSRQISEQLRFLEAALYLQRMVASFLMNRRILSGDIEMAIDRDCPQGPTLWISAMQSWFRKFEDIQLNVKLQAYAGDQCLVLHGTSVKRKEAAWSEIWDCCTAWEKKESKMKCNLGKTETLFIPASRKIRRRRV